MANILFLPSYNEVGVPDETTILQAAILAGEQLESTCGGKGTCGKCQVQINDSWVLACKARAKGDMIVRLKARQKDAHARKTGLEHNLEMEILPYVKKYFLKLTSPTVEDQTPDWERLVASLPGEGLVFNRQIAVNLPKTLHRADFKVTAAVAGKHLLAVEEEDTTQRMFGLAIDIGTTTMAVYLMDLTTGRVVGSGAETNPQRRHGADVLSRINYAAKGIEQLRDLQTLMTVGLNKVINFLCEKNGVSKKEVYQTVIVGNTTMSHLFLGIDPTYLGPAPFIPVFCHSVQVEARESGLDVLGTGHVIVAPNVAGYVGSDTVSVMIAAKMEQLSGFSLIIDIGTNGEIILAGDNRILTCSTAAGPAFEGAEIKYGMRAADGAIEKVKITNDVELKVIGEIKPIGICGSGLIDAIAEMVKVGIINKRGQIANRIEDLEKLSLLVRARIRRTEKSSEFVLVWGKESATAEDLVLTQKDIRELQLAKGAIRAGIEILMKEMGIEPEQLDRVLLAGAFGNYINIESALRIGMFPNLPIERIQAIGNAAGDGAIMMLLSKMELENAGILAGHTGHLELSIQDDFQRIYFDSLSFDEYSS